MTWPVFSDRQWGQLRSLVVRLISVIVLAAHAGCSNEGGDPATQTYQVKIAHQLTENTHLHKGLIKLEELLEEKSAGRLEVDVYSGGTLGGSRDLIEGLRIGTIQIASTAISVLSGYDSKMMLSDMPFLFETHQEAEELLDGEIGHRMSGDLPDKAQLRVLAYWVSGFRSIFSKEGLVTVPADLEGLRIRVMETPIHQDAFTALGAVATPIDFGELYSSLEQGVVDAAENDADAFYKANFYEVCKYYSLTNHAYTAVPLVISERFYEKLPEDLRKIVEEAAIEAGAYERKIARQMNDDAMAKLKEEGVEIESVDPKPFRQKLKSEGFYERYRDKIGPEIVDAAMEELGR